MKFSKSAYITSKFSARAVQATFSKEEGEAFDVELRIEKDPGNFTKPIVVQFESIDQLKQLTDYLLSMAHELVSEREEVPLERVRCGSCKRYGITDTGFSICRLHGRRVASDSCICSDYK